MFKSIKEWVFGVFASLGVLLVLGAVPGAEAAVAPAVEPPAVSVLSDSLDPLADLEAAMIADGAQYDGPVGDLLSEAFGSLAVATPPTMPAVEFPVDLASIASSLAAAGITVLLLIFSTVIGFRLVRALFGWISGGMVGR